MSEYIIKDGELYHYGVPGMKWGVRKASISISRRPKLDRDLDKAKKKLANAKTDKARTKAQKKVDLLSKADPKAYETLKKNQLKVKVKLGLLGGIKVYAYAKSPKGQAKIQAGKTLVNRLLDKKFNASILDANGKVLRRYNM